MAWSGRWKYVFFFFYICMCILYEWLCVSMFFANQLPSKTGTDWLKTMMTLCQSNQFCHGWCVWGLCPFVFTCHRRNANTQNGRVDRDGSLLFFSSVLVATLQLSTHVLNRKKKTTFDFWTSPSLDYIHVLCVCVCVCCFIPCNPQEFIMNKEQHQPHIFRIC